MSVAELVAHPGICELVRKAFEASAVIETGEGPPAGHWGSTFSCLELSATFTAERQMALEMSSIQSKFVMSVKLLLLSIMVCLRKKLKEKTNRIS